MVRLFNILDYWAQLAQRSVALPNGLGYPSESPDRVRSLPTRELLGPRILLSDEVGPGAGCREAVVRDHEKVHCFRSLSFEWRGRNKINPLWDEERPEAALTRAGSHNSQVLRAGLVPSDCM